MLRLIAILLSFCLLGACGNTSQTSSFAQLSANEFQQMLQKTSQVQLIDVRTPEEFAVGYIDKAVNIDINGDSFESKLSRYDVEKPLFIYCLGGGRSHEASEIAKKMGFKEIYDLKGGIMAWNNKELPLTIDKEKQTSTTTAAPESVNTNDELKQLIANHEIVLIDYHATWCGPCKAMKPAIEKLKQEYADKVLIYQIDVDHAPELVKSQAIEGVPTLQLYKNGQLFTTVVGGQSEEALRELLNK
jgi:thioredoxin 1